MATIVDNKQRYRMCCNHCHVERGALIIGYAGVAMSALSTLVSAYEFSYYNFVNELIYVALFGCIIFAQRRNEPKLYFPFLIVTGIEAVCLIIVSFLFIVLAAFWPTGFEKLVQWHSNELLQPQDEIADARIEAFTYTLVMTLIAGLMAWLWLVVYLAYEFLNVGVSSTPAGGPSTTVSYNVV